MSRLMRVQTDLNEYVTKASYLPQHNRIMLIAAKPEKSKQGLVALVPLLALMGSLFITTATCFLYASHKASTNAYFNAFGLPTGIYDPSMQEMLCSGGIAGLRGAFIIAVALFFSGPAFLMSAWIGAWMTSKFSFPRVNNAVTKIALKTGMKTIDPLAVNISVVTYGLGALGLGLILLIPLPLVYVEKQGRERAEEQINAIANKDAETLKKHRIAKATIIVEEEGKPVTYKGYRIYCRMGKACLLRDEQRSTIVPLEKLRSMTFDDA